MSRLTRVLAVGAATAAAAIMTAPPAAAHGLGGLKPSNYETRLLGLSPQVRGIDVEVTDLGTRLRLTNTTNDDAVVLGYDDEPYFRVGPRGAFENVRSPATYLNTTLTAAVTIPKRADSSAPPEWQKLSGSTRVTWHDHRAHFMGVDDPPVVQRDPANRHLIQRWTVKIQTADGVVAVRGTVVWVPGPSPYPWLAFAAALAAAVFALTRTRWWRAAATVGIAALVAGESLHLIGSWGATTVAVATRLGYASYSIAGLIVGAVALGWIARRGSEAAIPAVLVAAVVLLVVGGLTDATALGQSQVPNTLGATVARLLVATTLGVGTGLVAGCGARLRSSLPA